MNSVLRLALVIVAPLPSVVPSTAQDVPEGPPPPANAAGLPTDEEVGARLRELGFRPMTTKRQSGRLTYHFHVERDGVKWEQMVGLTASRASVTITASLQVVNEPDLVPAAAWRRLLSKNSELTVGRFSFAEGNRMLRYEKTLTARGMTAKSLGVDLEKSFKVVVDSKAVWNLNALPRGIAAAPSPPNYQSLAASSASSSSSLRRQ